jgi:glycosyltransferase involved in cell wall biosynthesis
MEWPSLSIIVPSLNSAGYIDRALNSILKQEYKGKLQVIVADGGSTDGTTDILKRYNQIIWWSRPDRGATDASNKALEVADGDVIVLLPSDDFFLKDAFKTLIPRLVARPDIDFVSGSLVILEEHRQRIAFQKKNHVKISSPLDYVTGATAIPLQGTVVRRKVYDHIGHYRLEANICSDYDFVYRMLHFHRGLAVPKYVAAFQKRYQQITSQNGGEWSRSIRYVIESCEQDEKYSSVFRLPENKRNELLLKNDLFWLNYAGDTEDRKRGQMLADSIVNNRKTYPKQLVGYAEYILARYRYPADTSKMLLSLIRRTPFSSVVVGIVVDALRNRLLSFFPSLFVDIDWWREEKQNQS